MLLISKFVGPPNLHLNTDPVNFPHSVVGGDRNRGNTKQMQNVRKKVVFFPLKEVVKQITNQFRPFEYVP